jgi:hypothetical protein
VTQLPKALMMAASSSGFEPLEDSTRLHEARGSEWLARKRLAQAGSKDMRVRERWLLTSRVSHLLAATTAELLQRRLARS